MTSFPFLARVSVLQGVYFLITGLWPLFSMRTFLKITGPKMDLWLVNTVGVLVSVIGLVLTAAGLRRKTDQQTILLGAGSAAGLMGVDAYYVSKRRIPPVYLIDAASELGLIILWASGLQRRR